MNEKIQKIMPNERKRKILHGNEARIDPNSEIASVFLMQAISNIEGYDGVTPVISDADTVRARDWSIENKK